MKDILRFFLLGIIPVAFVIGIPVLLVYIFGAQAAGHIAYAILIIIVIIIFGMLVDIGLEEIKENRDRNSRNSHL